MGLGKVDTDTQIGNLLYTKITKHKNQLRVYKTSKTSKKKTGEKLHDVDLSNDFIDMTPKNTGNKNKINKEDYIKLKSFCRPKEAPYEKGSYGNKYLQIICLICC